MLQPSAFSLQHSAFSISPIPVLRDGVLLELLVEVAARRTDDFGGLRNVPGVLPELLDEKLALGGLLELAQGPGGEVTVAGFRCDDRRGLDPDDVAEVVGVDRVARRHDEQALDSVSQLAHVPLPARLLHQLERRRGKALRPPVAFPAEEIDEMTHQRRDVLAAIAQRRHADRDDAQTEIEILAEGAALDLRLEVLVGRGNHADVDLDRARRSETLDLPFLQHPEDFGLRLRAHIADFVEEDGAAVRLLELADLLLGGPGERAFLVAEELRLDQLLRDGGAIDLDESVAAAQAVAVDGAPDELLAGAALSEQEHRCGRRRRALDRVPDLAERGAVADHLVARFDGALERPVFVDQPRLVQRVPDRDEHPLARQRLLDEVERAELRCLDRGAHRAMPRDDDHGQDLVDLTDLLQRLEAVKAAHLDVEEGEVRRLALDEGQRLGAARRLLHVVTVVLEDHPDRAAGLTLVIHAQNATFHRGSTRARTNPRRPTHRS